MTKTFAAAINCIDGRTHVPVIEHLTRAYAVDYVDMITEPGVCKVLAENKDEAALAALKRKLEISVRRHGSKLVAVAAHHDCAACSEDKQEQTRALLAARDIVGSWGLGIRIVLLWIDEHGQATEVG
jgi:carbonic anhydrase